MKVTIQIEMDDSIADVMWNTHLASALMFIQKDAQVRHDENPRRASLRYQATVKPTGTLYQLQSRNYNNTSLRPSIVDDTENESNKE